MVDPIQKLGRRISLEGEAGACAFILVVWLYSIFKTSDFMDNRQRAVSEGDELCQAAGLEGRWNQECIAAGIDKMGQLFIISDFCRNLIWILTAEVTEHILVSLVAAAKYNEVDISSCQFIHDAIHKVQPLLVCETGDDGKGEDISVLGQIESFLQFQLVFLLAVTS